MKRFWQTLLGCVGFFTLLTQNIKAQSIPTYSISTVRGTNSFEGGGADSNNVVCKLRGVVYGRNFGSTGNRIQFSLRDATGEIGIFKNVNDLPIQLTEGDSIRAIGIVNSFNGLAQITLDSVRRLASNRPLVAPRLVNQLDESTESELVRLEGWQLSNPATWPTLPTGSGFTVKIKKGMTELDLRIDNDCDLFGAPAPLGFLNIVGIGGQFDSSIPRNSGYQLLPRSMADITQGQAPPKPVIQFVRTDTTVSESAGQVSIPVRISPTPESQTVAIFAVQDSNSVNGVDYTLPPSNLLTFPANFSGFQFITVQVNSNAQDQPNRVLRLRIRTLAGDTNYLIGADSVLRFQILDDDLPLRTFPIAQVRGNNSLMGGVADSLGLRCILKGALTGPNFLKSENLVEWAITDASGSIHLFYDDVLSENLREGDSVQVTGTILQEYGRSFIYMESISKTADSAVAPQTLLVDSLSEFTESKLVRVAGYSIVNPQTWNPNPNGFSVKVSNGSRTLDLWLDNDAVPVGTPVPAGVLSIAGIGDQRDSLEPYTAGYQLKPRSMADILPLSGVKNLGPAEPKVQFFPNPFQDQIQVLLPSDTNLDDECEIHLYGLNGGFLFQGRVPAASLGAVISMELSRQKGSIFYVKLKSPGGTQSSHSLVRK